jgi:hypothetical protein
MSRTRPNALESLLVPEKRWDEEMAHLRRWLRDDPPPAEPRAGAEARLSPAGRALLTYAQRFGPLHTHGSVLGLVSHRPLPEIVADPVAALAELWVLGYLRPVGRWHWAVLPARSG